MKVDKLYANMERTIAHSDEIEAILGDETFKITATARGKFASHEKTGEHQITQTKGKVDHFVNLEGPSALSIEEGHWVGKGVNKRWVEGLHVLRDSIPGATL